MPVSQGGPISDHTNAAGLNIPVRKKGRTISVKRIPIALVFITPTPFFYGFYNIFAIGKTIYFSFLDWNGIVSGRWAGRDSWVRLVHDPDVRNALKNNLILMVISTCIQFLGALILVLLTNPKLKGVRIYKVFWSLPVLLSTLATGIPWNLMYDLNLGLLQAVLRGTGKGNLVKGWLGEPAYALPCVLIVIYWTFIPFYMILLKAGLTNVPGELIESAKLDGASSWQCFWSMTFLLLLPTIRAAVLLNTVGSSKYFDLIWIMTGGEPSGASELVATYLYKQGIQGWNMGCASATASFLFLFCGTFAIVYYGATSAFGKVDGERSRKSGRRKTD